jgi:hypothetical protein
LILHHKVPGGRVELVRELDDVGPGPVAAALAPTLRAKEAEEDAAEVGQVSVQDGQGRVRRIQVQKRKTEVQVDEEEKLRRRHLNGIEMKENVKLARCVKPKMLLSLLTFNHIQLFLSFAWGPRPESMCHS